MKSMIIGLTIGMILGAAVLAAPQAQQPPLPQREALTVAEVFEQLGRCQATAADDQRYAQKLVDRIRELEKALAKSSAGK